MSTNSVIAVAQIEFKIVNNNSNLQHWAHQILSNKQTTMRFKATPPCFRTIASFLPLCKFAYKRNLTKANFITDKYHGLFLVLISNIMWDSE